MNLASSREMAMSIARGRDREMDSPCTLRDLSELSPVGRHDLVMRGVPKSTCLELVKSFGSVTDADLLGALGLSARTLRSAPPLLPREQSSIVVALVEVVGRAEEVLGSRDIAERWLFQPAISVNGARPIDLLSSGPGIEAVKELLGRVEYGVYA